MTKEEHYNSLLPQVKALCEGETDLIAKMANVAALLHMAKASAAQHGKSAAPSWCPMSRSSPAT